MRLYHCIIPMFTILAIGAAEAQDAKPTPASAASTQACALVRDGARRTEMFAVTTFGKIRGRLRDSAQLKDSFGSTERFNAFLAHLRQEELKVVGLLAQIEEISCPKNAVANPVPFQQTQK